MKGWLPLPALRRPVLGKIASWFLPGDQMWQSWLGQRQQHPGPDRITATTHGSYKQRPQTFRGGNQEMRYHGVLWVEFAEPTGVATEANIFGTSALHLTPATPPRRHLVKEKRKPQVFAMAISTIPVLSPCCLT